jgi:hypothetical protein
VFKQIHISRRTILWLRKLARPAIAIWMRISSRSKKSARMFFSEEHWAEFNEELRAHWQAAQREMR